MSTETDRILAIGGNEQAMDRIATTDQAYERMVTTDAELQGKRVAEIAKMQGWDTDELLDLAGRFLDVNGWTGRFANYLETIQRAEQKEQA